jgi:ABC-2 type transport system permease protein
MKLWDIALKDLRRNFLNAFFLVFGLILPLLTGALFYFAFGGLSSDEGFELPITEVQVANQDQVSAEFGGFSAGQMLVDFLTSDDVADLVHATVTDDPVSARAAVDSQQAAVAVIIPEDFTRAAFEPEGRATIELYQDPTLSLGPGIVESLVSHFVDAFAGSKIAAQVALDQLTGRGQPVDAALIQEIAAAYGNWAAALGESQREEGASSLLDIEHVADGEGETNAGVAMVIGLIMSGMMVFYVFFTGATASQSILQEEEAGTLPRLFTTPTPRWMILGGKFLSTFVLLAVQVVVILILSNLIFGIKWGAPLPTALVTLGLVVLAAGFGIFIISLLKSVRQTGIIVGGVMTVAGMLGMARTFTANMSNPPQSINTLSLIVPQGWGVRGWQLLLEGGGLAEVLPTVAVTVALGGVFFAIGVMRFRKRFS